MSQIETYQIAAASLFELASNHGTPMVTLVTEVAYFSSHHGFDKTARWLLLEHTGYGASATLEENLGVQAQHPLVERVLSYRVLRGLIHATVGATTFPLEVQKLATDSISRIQELAQTSTFVEGRVAVASLPPHPVTTALAAAASSRGENFVRVFFGRDQVVNLLSGLRREILTVLLDCMAGQRPY